MLSDVRECILSRVYPEADRAHALDKGEAIKLLKGGIEMSDRVVTVAPSYKV